MDERTEAATLAALLSAGLVGFCEDPPPGFYFPVKDHPAVDAWWKAYREQQKGTAT